MLISVINQSQRPDDEVQTAIRAVNRQIAEDFEPYWSFGGRLRLEGSTGKKPRRERQSDMRGDAVLYIRNPTDEAGVEGFHDRNFADIPFGCVFLELSDTLGEDWTATLSHEALELIGDPLANLMVRGPDPHDRRRMVFHVFEMCDAVQDETYQIDGITVSNFVLPSYFTPGEAPGRRNDFLGKVHPGGTLVSFGINPGGYIGFYDPGKPKNPWSDATRAGDEAGLARLAKKRAAKAGRGFRRRHPDKA